MIIFCELIFFSDSTDIYYLLIAFIFFNFWNMNIKKIAIKSMAPATAGAIILASGALSALASFVVSPTLPSPCVASYGYDAGYGYGYGYDTATCMNPIPPTAPILNGGAYVPSPIVYGSSSTPWDS